MVVADLSVLHDEEAACRDKDQEISLMYVVAFGLDVRLTTASGVPNWLAYEAVRHA